MWHSSDSEPGMSGFPQLELPLIHCRCNYCAVGLRNLDDDSRPRHYQEYISKGRIVTKGILPQPLAAWIGLVGSLLLIVVSSSVWWNVRQRHHDKGGVSTAWSVSVYFLVSFTLFTVHQSLAESDVRKGFFWPFGQVSNGRTETGRRSGGFPWIEILQTLRCSAIV